MRHDGAVGSKGLTRRNQPIYNGLRIKSIIDMISLKTTSSSKKSIETSQNTSRDVSLHLSPTKLESERESDTSEYYHQSSQKRSRSLESSEEESEGKG